MITMENSMINSVCPKCGSPNISFSFPTADAFDKRGSKIVRKRNVEFVAADWVCFACRHKWSAPACIRGIRFNRGKSRSAVESRILFDEAGL